MAEFCQQCSIELFGEDTHDLSGLISEEDVNKGYGYLALCEDCGATLVDHNGKCICNCLKHHNPEAPE